MDHHALQRALVMALHDDAFVEAMHADPEGTLAPLGVGAAERAQLLAVDRRAWRTDPLRRRRTLRVLAEEYKASTTLALAVTRSVAFAEGFFGSRFFREAILARAPLAPAFGDYLADAVARGVFAAPHAADVVRLEATTARCRRARARPPRPGVGLASGVAVGRFDAGALEAVQRLERYLFELSLMPQLALCADAPPLPAPPPPGGGALALLFTPSATGVALTPIDDDLARVLEALAEPVPRERLAVVLAPVGVPAGRAAALVDALLEEGMLAEGERPGVPASVGDPR